MPKMTNAESGAPCKNNCTKAIILMKDTPLYEIINDFRRNMSTIENDPTVLGRFYTYIKDKYKIPCETGMLFIEKLVMSDYFDQYIKILDAQNELIESKIELYQWIKMSHLDIDKFNDKENVNTKCLHLDNTISNFAVDFARVFSKIEETDLPSIKMHYFMKAVKTLYASIGQANGADMFFPCLVYCLIKTKMKNIYLHIKFIKYFARKYDNVCEIGCKHGFKHNICCDCVHRNDWEAESEYYLVTVLAALEFIQKIEYYSLRIDLNEFDYEISRRIEKINIK